MNYWACTARRYRSTSIIERVHKAFFNYYQFNSMTYMLDQTILARKMTALDLEFERTLHYHDEGYESDNDYGLPPQITRPVHMYSIFTTETSFDLDDFTTAQCLISSFTIRHPRTLPFHEGVYQHISFDETPLPMPEINSEDHEEPLSTADLDDPMWDKEPVPDNREYLCIHKILGQPSKPHPDSLYQ